MDGFLKWFCLKVNFSNVEPDFTEFHKFIIVGKYGDSLKTHSYIHTKIMNVIFLPCKKLESFQDRKVLFEESLKYPVPVRVCLWCNGVVWRKGPCTVRATRGPIRGQTYVCTYLVLDCSLHLNCLLWANRDEHKQLCKTRQLC